MTIRFHVPNGYMTINVEYFMQHARRSQIRKMLKWLSSSNPDKETIFTIKEWLKDSVKRSGDKITHYSYDYLNHMTKLKELETEYHEMKSPCYAKYTRDEDALKLAKSRLAETRSKGRDAKNMVLEWQKLEKHYQKILDDLEKTFDL